MFGDQANKLVLDAHRTSNLPEITLYQSDLVDDIVKETNDLGRDVDYITEQQRTNPEGTSAEQIVALECQLFVARLSMRRNKRCLLAHQKLRADKMNEFAWLNIDPSDSNSTPQPSLTKTGALGSNYTTRMILDNLSNQEQEYFKQYSQLLVDMKSKYVDIDLSGDLEPPTSIFIDVRVLKDGGEVQTEYGVFNLIKDSQFYVRKSDVERLIQQGYLEEL
ncbi:DNA replication protein psf1 [Yamadazyma tenuis]|uniref:DNA replication complex GINS protein PSF1 n=1 Tax=Candida tenuis (strain ATCC 10573 / BCRC 21748 / CBS 615 / JCM 9827 / NBRC 10315 / NRRL Y-1498 / VKM Y-70) TaxID=590646 RepID=G3BFG6_CANTC|nr:GINS complex, Psf1 component [Yamadazyma tenuis ATCC 10573]EGV60687.1 GINS complex, Psf1 component [Yamadazyma tenuis ATCC 10573]WEJ94061.1 DNA replication protein psf1 [Yamadazyma tenuis]